ncbi:MAG: EAL domain-containing protein [Methylophilaceae bacterium]
MLGSYDYRLVLLSLLVAFIASLAAFILSAKVHRSEPRAAELWLLSGALAMGSGIWCMHFVGMLAFSLPIPLGYAFDYSALSWLIAVATSWLALKITQQPELSRHLLITGGLFMGTGISGMHYTGMHAMHMSPPITYSQTLLSLSILIAVAASIVALLILFRLRTQDIKQAWMSKILAAAVMSVAITGMHYTAMAAAEFSPDSVCGAAATARPELLAVTIALGVVGLLLATIIVSALDAHLEGRAASLNLSLKDANDELSRMAMIDALTQLPNRRLFQQHLEVAIGRTMRMGNSLAVAFIDLDGFKLVNDVLGHHVGDEVLLAVAKRLNTAVRGGDIVARMGGDEFVALLEDIKSDQDIVPIVDRIIHSLREVFFIDQHEISISASIGIAVYPRDGDIKHLLVCADAAMYRAKSDGKNQFRFYDADIELASDQLLEMQHGIRQALSRDELKLYFQPKIDSKTCAVVGVEALLRWKHPIKGRIAPTTFIPAAERFGMINQIGDWVIEESCRALYRLRAQGITLKIAINLSPQQFRNPCLVTDILQVLQRFDLPLSSIMFEITESSALDSLDQINAILTDFKHAGIEIGLNGFGTGNSSLTYLQRIKINELKLDRSFIATISSDKQTRAIVDAVIQLAHALKLRVVAAGVETEDQRKVLTELGCDQLQGFLFARPVPEENLAGLILRLTTIKQDPDTGKPEVPSI